MMVLCAWCEQEGRPAFMRDTDPHGRFQSSMVATHGICDAHQKLLLTKVRNLRRKETIRRIPRRLGLPNARYERSPIMAIYL